MAQIDETIASYLTALKIEGKTAKTIESYANSLADFRRVGRRLRLPETVMRRPLLRRVALGPVVCFRYAAATGGPPL